MHVNGQAQQQVRHNASDLSHRKSITCWWKGKRCLNRRYPHIQDGLRFTHGAFPKIRIRIVCLGLPKIRVTILGGPIIRIIVFRGLYWGPTIFRNYHMDSGSLTTGSTNDTMGLIGGSF